jgi:hypothetical protein
MAQFQAAGLDSFAGSRGAINGVLRVVRYNRKARGDRQERLGPWTPQATPPLPQPRTDDALRQRIDAYAFDKPKAALPFSRRLAMENGWENYFALRVIEEYRRFVYLACISEAEVASAGDAYGYSGGGGSSSGGDACGYSSGGSSGDSGCSGGGGSSSGSSNGC